MRSALFIIMTILFAAPGMRAAAAPPPTDVQSTDSASAVPASVEAVATVSAVKLLDGLGRIARFTDAHGREFECSYDSKGRVTSAQAVRGEHISQVKSIGYDPQGRFAGALIGVSYVVLASYLDDGTQVIRDRFGGLIARRGDLAHGYQSIQVNDPTGRLVSVVEGVDALLRSATNRP